MQARQIRIRNNDRHIIQKASISSIRVQKQKNELRAQVREELRQRLDEEDDNDSDEDSQPRGLEEDLDEDFETLQDAKTQRGTVFVLLVVSNLLFWQYLLTRKV
jgi:hypothetical protein